MKNVTLGELELAVDPVISGIDSNVGFTRLYGSYIAWRTESTPTAIYSRRPTIGSKWRESTRRAR